MSIVRYLVTVAALLAGSVAAAPTAAAQELVGIRFTVDSADAPSPARGVLAPVSGTIEFAAGRGRFTLASVSNRAVAVGGVALIPPLGSPGDYYLFDSTGCILVRPGSRTFATFPFAGSWVHPGNALDPSEGFMEFSAMSSDTLHAPTSVQAHQHLPFTVRWHLDRRRVGSPPIDVLARGRIDVADAPPGEASVVRWFGLASAAAALSAGNDSLTGADLQLTTAVVLPANPTATVPTLIVLHHLTDLAHARIAASRLTLPAGYTQAPWPGFETDDRAPERLPDAGARWRVMPPDVTPR